MLLVSPGLCLGKKGPERTEMLCFIFHVVQNLTAIFISFLRFEAVGFQFGFEMHQLTFQRSLNQRFRRSFPPESRGNRDFSFDFLFSLRTSVKSNFRVRKA